MRVTYQEPLTHAERELRARARWEHQCREEVRRCLEGHEGLPGPLYWTRFTRTFDEAWKQRGAATPYSPFPDKPYFKPLFEHFLNDARLFVPKSRDVMASWSAVAFAVWTCQFTPRQRVMIQSQKEEKACELIKGTKTPGYARTLIEQQPDWLQARFPLVGPMSEMSQTVIAWANGSTLQGVPSGPDQIRSAHPTVLIIDEAAFLDDFEATYGAADPVCQKVIAISSASPGWFGDTVMQALEHAA